MVEAPMAPMVRKTQPSAVAQGSKGFSSIGSGLIVEGNIYGTSDLVVDGTVRGDVKVGHLTIGESGNIEGKVEAESIEVRGRIVGSILGKHIRLQSTAYVEGDITHDQLSIEVGAYFQGHCLQTRKAETVSFAPEAIAAPAAINPANISPFTTSNDDAARPASVTPAASAMSAYDMNALSDLK
jgi:cytoskeletal protein CcmA (bactofilin family)